MQRLGQLPWVVQPDRAAAGCRPQTLAPAPLGTVPQLPQPGGGTWCQAAETVVGDWPAPRATPPTTPWHPSCPAAGTAAEAQTSVHTPEPSPCSFLSPVHISLSFSLFSPLSVSVSLFQHVNTVETKSAGTMRPLTAVVPSPRRACQHSFHPPRAGTAANGGLLINKRNQINQEHNRGICCTQNGGNNVNGARSCFRPPPHRVLPSSPLAPSPSDL